MVRCAPGGDAGRGGGAVSAIVAAVTGYLLGRAAGTRGHLAGHQRVGIGVAVWSVAAAIAYLVSRRSARPVIGPVPLALTLPPLLVAGHLGGLLTHGEGYLTEHLPRWFGRGPGPVRALASLRTSMSIGDLVAPVLEEVQHVSRRGSVTRRPATRYARRYSQGRPLRRGPRCPAQRLERNRAPRLAAAVSQGRDAAGRPSRADRGRSVPPALVDRPGRIVRRDPGGRRDRSAADADHRERGRAPAARRAGDSRRESPPRPIRRRWRPFGRSAFSVSPLSAGTSLLQVRCTNVAQDVRRRRAGQACADRAAGDVASLGGTRVTDAGLAALERFTNLTRLHLDRTDVTDTGLQHVARLPRLELPEHLRIRCHGRGSRESSAAWRGCDISTRGGRRSPPPAPNACAHGCRSSPSISARRISVRLH